MKPRNSTQSSIANFPMKRLVHAFCLKFVLKCVTAFTMLLAMLMARTLAADPEDKPAKGAPGLKIAFTFDDLPAHSALPANTTRAEIAQKIVSALSNEHMPPVYGMVNGALIEKKPEDAVVLRIWHDAGNPVGNHTWSHVHLNQSTPGAFESEITRNEPTISSVMTKGDWHWFRYPFLDEGDNQDKRREIRSFLAARGY